MISGESLGLQVSSEKQPSHKEALKLQWLAECTWTRTPSHAQSLPGTWRQRQGGIWSTVTAAGAFTQLCCSPKHLPLFQPGNLTQDCSEPPPKASPSSSPLALTATPSISAEPGIFPSNKGLTICLWICFFYQNAVSSERRPQFIYPCVPVLWLESKHKANAN